MSGLKSDRAVYFSADLLCSLHPPDKPQSCGETAVDDYNPVLFWVLLVSY